MCNKKLCFTNSILNNCNLDCKALFSDHKKCVGETWKTSDVAYAHCYICDSLIKSFNNTNVIRVIDKIVKKQTFTDYCYQNYIDAIFSSIREPLLKFIKGYRDCEACQVAILDLLIRIYGEPNDPNNKLYKRYLKLNPKHKSLELLQIHNKFMENTGYITEVNMRKGQNRLRKILLNHDCRCKLCGANISNLLILSHSKPYNDKNIFAFEKLDIFNVFLLCPNHDKAYDKGYISFNDDGTILISPKLDEFNRNLLNIHEDMKIELEEGHLKYIKYHREHVLKINI